MNAPTHHELMQYADGSLAPERAREISRMIEGSPSLKKELSLLEALRRDISSDAPVVPAGFTERVMSDILPAPVESHRYRLAQYSSSIFAMSIVLSLVIITLLSGTHGDPASSGTLGTVFDSYTTVYERTVAQWSVWVRHVLSAPVPSASSQSGRFILLGLAVLFAAGIADELFGKRFFRTPMKH